jgi:hypothetical protein
MSGGGGYPDGTSPTYMYLKSVQKVEIKASPGGNISKEYPALKLQSEKQRTI